MGGLQVVISTPHQQHGQKWRWEGGGGGGGDLRSSVHIVDGWCCLKSMADFSFLHSIQPMFLSPDQRVLTSLLSKLPQRQVEIIWTSKISPPPDWDRQAHRVHRVAGFLSSRLNWVPPPHNLQDSVAPPSVPRVRHPIPTMWQTLWYSKYTIIPLRASNMAKLNQLNV